MKKTELGYTDTRILMGHRVRDDTTKRYLKPDYDHLKKLYFKNMDAVTIFNKVEVYDLTDEKVEQLEQDNIEMKKIIKELREDIENIAKDPAALAQLYKQIKIDR